MGPRDREGTTDDGMRLATNAPPDWPAIRLQLGENRQRNADALAQAFVDARAARGGPSPSPTAIGRSVMRLEGFLFVPLWVSDGEREIPVLLYPKGDADDAERFRGAQVILRASGYPEPVYYAPRSLPPTTEVTSPLEPFAPEVLWPREALSPGNWAMWWQGPGSERFSGSQVAEAMSQAYEALEGYHTYAFSALLRAWGIVEPESLRVALPKHPVDIELDGPDGIPLILMASAEKGLRFAFHVETPPVFRDCFWMHFSEFAKRVRAELVKQGASGDEPGAHSPLGWFRSMASGVAASEEHGGAEGRLLGVARLVNARALGPPGR